MDFTFLTLWPPSHFLHPQLHSLGCCLTAVEALSNSLLLWMEGAHSTREESTLQLITHPSLLGSILAVTDPFSQPPQLLGQQYPSPPCSNLSQHCSRSVSYPQLLPGELRGPNVFSPVFHTAFLSCQSHKNST